MDDADVERQVVAVGWWERDMGLPIFSTGWHDARFVARIIWMEMKMKMIFLIDDMKMKMNGNMNDT